MLVIMYDLRCASGRVTRDLAPFAPASGASFFVLNASANEGVQCRFGERGAIAAAHFDSGRNSVFAPRCALPPSRG